jgi:hypothetical protein
MMKRALSIRRFAKGAGTVVLCLIALDLVATVVTLAVGSEFLHRSVIGSELLRR